MKFILVVYFVYSCSWIAFLKKQKRTLATKHLMETTFLTFCFQFTDFTEDLNDLRCVRCGWLAIGTPDFQKLCKYSPLPKWNPTCVLLILDILCCCRTCYFHYCINCCARKAVCYTHKAFKVYFCYLIEEFFTTKLDSWHFASSYCVSVRRSFCYNKSTVSNKLVS